MDLLNGSTPQLVESGAQNNIKNVPLATSTTAPDKVINIKTDSSQIGGNVSDEELLKGLLTDQLCHVCNAVLLFESQRLSHYEGKKHAQKLKLYLHNKRDEMRHKESSGLVHRMPNDKDRFCELCNMVFTSAVVAKSHYEGRVHSKNLRKQSAPKLEVGTLPKPQLDRATEDRLSGSGDCTDPPTNSTACSSDPNKYCALCEISFNNGQMAVQHYNGRKHQRNLARQQMMQKLEELHEENPLTCAICNLQFNSVEMYQAHMQGNKHYMREKKVFELCKSQKKSYNTFADELAHYIEVQKARGITPRIGKFKSKDETQKECDEVEVIPDWENEHITQQYPQTIDNFSPNEHITQQYPQTIDNFAPTYHLDLPYHAPQFTVQGFQPPYTDSPWLSDGWDSYKPPSPPYLKPSVESGARFLKRHRKCSSSSSYSTSSSSLSSSCTSSGASNHDEGKHRQREKRRSKKSRRERGRRSRTTNSDKTRQRQQNKARDYNPEERRSDDNEAGGDRKKKRKYHSKHRSQEKKELKGEDGVKDSIAPADLVETQQETEENVVQLDDRQAEHDNTKTRKDKKKAKEMLDNRTEEEKLWDDSILGF
ncbi:zinc finger matrin-type protein 1 [Corythoichthys intestinalis]|uniref:zinc finger matrin-type protein 1 n=1 Tax=Corythoichthys intestinalis TaxID=161448 RepID=UPI0025A66AF8|nr:zinc finger matrin-type protein 1 [Corythoichthys intestinalis]XP_061814140.1 zinc finger matrin-type protein 1-like [Nerophis lumbriciformis]